MAIIISPSATNAKLAYHNLFTDAGVTVTASDEVTGYEKENAYDLKQYDWWKQSATGSSWIRASFVSAKAADYMAVWGHNLHEVGGSVKPQYSTDGGTTWNDADAGVAPTTGRTLYIKFSSVSAADWRCLVTTTTGQSTIAGIQIGEAMTLQRGLRPGFAPPTLSPIIEHKVAMSENGINLGGAIKRTGIDGSIVMTLLTPAWVRSDLVPLIDWMNLLKPVVFSWDSESYSDEACLIWATRRVPPPSYSDPLYMSATIPFEGIE